MVKAETLHKELQANANHDARCQGEKTPIRYSIWSHVRLVGKFEPQRRNACSEGLGQAT